jgi:hypothetical protein
MNIDNSAKYSICMKKAGCGVRFMLDSSKHLAETLQRIQMDHGVRLTVASSRNRPHAVRNMGMP